MLFRQETEIRAPVDVPPSYTLTTNAIQANSDEEVLPQQVMGNVSFCEGVRVANRLKDTSARGFSVVS